MKEFNLVNGVSAPNLAGIYECYQVAERSNAYIFSANISAENIENVLKCFCDYLDEPCFFILETPTNKNDEELMEDKSSLHCDVHYCDGLSKQDLLEIISEYGELLINDGLTCFGFASHSSRDELYIGKYKIADIFTADKKRYEDFMREMDIPFEEEIKTVWDNFSRETPGSVKSIIINRKSIYDVLKELNKYNIYLAERRKA